VRLESPGGMVHEYGFCSSQLNRVKEAGVPLTICVDKVAASGGYMMAVVGHKILCAPFAIVGSIGVVAQVPNFNKLLKKNDINYTEYTAGEYKRTVSLLGEITPKGEEKFKEELEETHRLFKHFVGHHRPQLDLPKIATGEHWYGTQALGLGLIDQIGTSDDYLLAKRKTADIFKVTFKAKKNISEKLAESFSKSLISVSDYWFERLIYRFH
jgi:serine protease SohB